MTKNGSKHNGSGNGQDKNKDKVVQFPTLADRDRMRKEKIAQEDAWRAEYKAKQKALKSTSNPPFLNVGKIPLFVKIMFPVIIGVHILMELTFSEVQIMQTFQMFGVMPIYYSSMVGWNSFVTPLSHMFLHGGWMHLAFNSLMLVALGTFMGREFGNKVATMVFFLCGIGGALLYVAFNWGEQLPLIGCSGATSGFFGIFLIVMQKRGAFSQFGAVRKHGAMPLIIFWLAFMIGTGLLLGGQSWEAHLGGFLTGLIWLSWIVRKDIKFWKL